MFPPRNRSRACQVPQRTVAGWSICLLLIVCAFSLDLCAQRGALTAARSLDELTQEADLIVHGNVRSIRVEPHPQFTNLMTVVVSLDVQDTLKGAARKTVQFRQYVWDIRDQRDAVGYKKGQELLLLLGPVSKYGLSSPVGLEQGRFRILRDASGTATAVNGRGNVGLLAQTEAHAQARGIKLSARQTTFVRRPQPGPLPLSDLKDTIRTLARAQ